MTALARGGLPVDSGADFERLELDGLTTTVEEPLQRWTLRIGDEELCVAHARVIKTVPGGDQAAVLRASVVTTGKSSAHATARGLPK